MRLDDTYPDSGSSLGRLTLINPLFPHPSRREYSKLAFVLLEDSSIVVSKSWNAHYISYLLIGTVAGNLTSSMRIHARQLFVVSLKRGGVRSLI